LSICLLPPALFAVCSPDAGTGKPFIAEVRATRQDDYARELRDWIGAPDP
jgi:hypothetical protein